MENKSKILSILSLVFSIISFFAGMFIFSIIGIVLGLVEEEKTGLTYAGIILGVISFLIDVSIIASYF
jgi:uncharacterized protein YqhQ